MAISLALQWTLDQTVDHLITLGRDVIQAATRDNVQPTALLACERFGATLAICPATRSKVEQLLKSQTGSTALGFIKAQIGYPKGGSAEQLSRSLAGVNFLALAAALISSTDTFEAATALEMMITETATDKTLVPTVYHLKDLLNVLEPRLNRICFMDEVLNWKEWWTCDNRTVGRERRRIQFDGEALPSADGLKNIVTALRGVYRIGEAKKVTFTARTAVPWLTAFITWCLGTCPKISTQHGRILHSQSDIPIDIVYSDNKLYNAEIKIEIFNVYNSFAEILTASLDHPHHSGLHLAAGMTTVPIYAKHVLASLDFESGLGHRALLQALPYALKQMRDEIVMAYSQRRFSNVDFENLPLKAAIGNPFPYESVIAKAMATYLSLDTSCKLENLAEGTSISNLTHVSLWLNEIKDSSGRARDFASGLGVIVADILVLSLFDSCQDSLMVYYNSPWRKPWLARGGEKFGRMIRDHLLREVKPLESESITEKVLAWALQLLRHDIAPTAGSLGDRYWGGSSFKGQVVFPKVFEEQCLRQDGYLELFCVPGVLTMVGKDHQPLSLIRCQESNLYSEDEHIRSMPITGSLNLIPDKRLSWRVIALDGYLLISMHWSRTLDNGRVNPYGALDIPTLTIFTDSCQHAPDMLIERQVTGCRYALPCSHLIPLKTQDTPPYGNRITIFPTRDNDGIRMIALSAFFAWNSFPKVLVNGGACINCLIDTCRLIQCHYIIL